MGWARGAVPLVGLVLAACISQAPEPVQTGSLLVTDARLVDFSEDAPAIMEGASLLLRDGQIVAVGDANSRFSAPESIDAGGRVVTPGLVDMHVHIWDEAALGAYLSYGVTTIRNMSGMPFHLELQREIDAGERLAPRLLTTGPILNSAGPNQQPNHQIVDDAASARAAVEWQVDAGFERIKLYSNLSREAFEEILKVADEYGLKITGHTPEGVRSAGVPVSKPFDIAFGESLDKGFETIEHVESILWHAMPGAWDEDDLRALAARIAASGAAVTPTRLAHHNLLRMAESGGDFASRDGVVLLNPFIWTLEEAERDCWANQAVLPVQKADRLQARLTSILHEEGVVLVAGSDAGIFLNVPGLSLVDELGLLVDAGLKPFDALKTATYNPAVILEEVDRTGCLNVGCSADLVIYECDPLEQISCVGQLFGLARDGKWLTAADLEVLRDRAAEHDIERTRQNLLAGLQAQGTPFPQMSGE